jgi:hypothetical protein
MKGLSQFLRNETGGKANLAFRADQGPKKAKPPSMEVLPVRIRPAEKQDGPVIYNSWLKSHASQNKDIPSWAFYPLHKLVVRRLLQSSAVLVAAGSTIESQDDIYGWICAQRSPRFLVMHYAFTKVIFRKRGLFRALLEGLDYVPGEPIMCSHRSWIMKDLKPRYNFQHIPHLSEEGAIEKVGEIHEDYFNKRAAE